MKTDKWYLKAIVIFYRIFMPVMIVFLFFVAPKVPFFQNQGFQNYNLIFRIIVCLIFCLFYFYVPYISNNFYYYGFPDFRKTNLVVDPKSKFFSSILIVGRFIALFGITEFILDLYLPLFGKYNFIVALLNSLTLTIPAIAQFLAVKE